MVYRLPQNIVPSSSSLLLAPVVYTEMFGIQGPEAYVYTSQSGCLDVPSINDSADFDETIKAMGVVGLSAQEQENIFRCISIILWSVDTPFFRCCRIITHGGFIQQVG